MSANTTGSSYLALLTVFVTDSPGSFFLNPIETSIGHFSLGILASTGPPILLPILGSTTGVSLKLASAPFNFNAKTTGSSCLALLTVLVTDSPGSFFLSAIESSIGHFSLGILASYWPAFLYPSLGSTTGVSLNFGGFPLKDSLKTASFTILSLIGTTFKTVSPG